MNIISEIFNNLFADGFKCESEHRNIFGLLQHPALRIIQTGNKVPGFVEDRGSAGPQQSVAHLLRNGL